LILDVTDDTFEAEVLTRSRELPVVVDFWATWCGPCRMLGPVLERLAREGEGRFVLAKVDVDRSPRSAQAFGVRSIPTVIAFRNGEIAGEFTGAIPESAVRKFLNGLFPSEADALAERALHALESDAAGAEALYRQALSASPGHVQASIGLAELLARRGETEEAGALLSRLSSDGPDGDRIDRLRSEVEFQSRKPDASEKELRENATESSKPGPVLLELGRLLAAEKRYAEALEALYRAAEASPELARGEAKELMVSIFKIVGIRSELADDYRARLARLLY
jgi:putative thioredoxin